MQQFKQKAWRYDGHTWAETDLALPAELVDWDNGLKAAGFRPARTIEIQRAAYCVSVHESSKEPGRFLVLMTTQGSIFPVLVDSFPALLTVINQMLPIIQMGGESQEKYRRADLE